MNILRGAGTISSLVCGMINVAKQIHNIAIIAIYR